ncbi:MAG TPA: monovalent cation/H(+) antiporter subunit G [Ilumatobacter sp.]|nr:monovalent cation/H(+) antiporter subunit G [Ilumatobacter sp.]
MADLIIGVLAIAGALLVVLAGVGVLRFPDLYSRMHATTKATTLGIALIAVAAAIALGDGRDKLLLAVAFIVVTAPAGAHFIGRAAYRAEGIEIHLDGPDDLASLLDENPPPPGPVPPDIA